MVDAVRPPADKTYTRAVAFPPHQSTLGRAVIAGLEERLRYELTVTLQWIADPLKMRTWTHLADRLCHNPFTPNFNNENGAMKQTFLCLLVAAILLQGGCRTTDPLPQDITRFKGKHVEEFLEQYRLTLKDAAYLDEPPCLLNALEFSNRRQLGWKYVEIWIRAGPPLFSTKRRWDDIAVKRAIITEVYTSEKYLR